MNKNFFLVIAILVCLPGMAQDDVVNKNDYVVIGDTAQRVGTINYVLGDKLLEFKATYQDSFTQYTVNDVSEFQFKKERYLRKEFEGEDLFFKVIEEGTFTVYGIGDSFIASDGKQLLKITESNYREQLNLLFSDQCNWEYNGAQAVFEEAFLKHLFKSYNDKDCFYVQKRSTSLFLAYGAPSIFVKNEDEGIDRSISGDGVVSISLSREVALFNWTSMLLSLQLVSEKGEVTMDPSTNQSIGGITIDNQSLLGTVQFRFYLNRFYLNGGFGANYTINNSTILRAKLDGSLERDELEFDQIGIAAIGGVGYRVYHSNTIQLSIEAQGQVWTRSNLRSQLGSIGLRIEI